MFWPFLFLPSRGGLNHMEPSLSFTQRRKQDHKREEKQQVQREWKQKEWGECRLEGCKRMEEKGQEWERKERDAGE